jgi:hypothetical protein
MIGRSIEAVDVSRAMDLVGDDEWRQEGASRLVADDKTTTRIRNRGFARVTFDFLEFPHEFFGEQTRVVWAQEDRGCGKHGKRRRIECDVV